MLRLAISMMIVKGYNRALPKSHGIDTYLKVPRLQLPGCKRCSNPRTHACFTCTGDVRAVPCARARVSAAVLLSLLSCVTLLQPPGKASAVPPYKGQGILIGKLRIFAIQQHSQNTSSSPSERNTDNNPNAAIIWPSLQAIHQSSTSDMGMSAASCQSVPSFEPGPYGKAQLEHFLLLYSTSFDGLAKVYKELGVVYHDLPLHIRSHSHFPQELQEFSATAFTCSDSREMPDMIQIMNQLRECFARARAAVVSGEWALATTQLYIAAGLMTEAEHRVAKLTWAMSCYESFIESLQCSEGAQDSCTRFRQARLDTNMLTGRMLMKLKWQDALPKSLQGKVYILIRVPLS